MSILIMLFLISVLILVHETGHFLAARAFNIKVEKFGFGLPIGPTLFEKKIGDVTVLVHAFLLGGYIAFPDDEKNCTLPKDSPQRFANKPIWQRIIVVSSGVLANVICAFVFVFLTAYIWGNLPSGKYSIFINDITAPKNETIWQSGAQPDDKIIEINNTKINNTYTLMKILSLSKKFDNRVLKTIVNENLYELKNINPAFKNDEIIPKDVIIKLPEKKLEPQISLDKMTSKGLKQPKISQIEISKKSQKIRTELENKTYYVSDGDTTLNDIAYAISDNYHPINMKVERNGQIISLKPMELNKEGKLGIKLYAQEILIPTTTPVAVLKTGTIYLWENTYMLIYGLYQLFTGQVPLKDLHGIVAITKIGGDMISHKGLASGLLLVAIISMDLAIINFLPIPALDGGHVLFLLLEKIHGKPIDEKIIEKIGSFFFLLLVLLMIFVVFNDIFALVTNKF